MGVTEIYGHIIITVSAGQLQVVLDWVSLYSYLVVSVTLHVHVPTTSFSPFILRCAKVN